MPATEVTRLVSEVTGVSVEEITGPRKRHRITRARFLTMAAQTAAHPHWALIDVAETIGIREHSTIYYGLCRYRELYDTDKFFRSQAEALGLSATIRANNERITRRRPGESDC